MFSVLLHVPSESLGFGASEFVGFIGASRTFIPRHCCVLSHVIPVSYLGARSVGINVYLLLKLRNVASQSPEPHPVNRGQLHQLLPAPLRATLLDALPEDECRVACLVSKLETEQETA